MRITHLGPIRAAALLLMLLLLAPAASAQERRVLEISLGDAVELALRHNLQVRIASLTPDVVEEQIRAARARFDPVFTFDVPRAFNRSSSPTSSSLAGADVLTQEQLAGGFAFNTTTTFGLSWNLAASASRFVTNNEFTTFNPRYDTLLRLDVRQPLLRNFGSSNKRQLLVAQNDFSVSREFFRAQLLNSVAQVIQSYWQLVNQFRGLEIARQGLALAQEQLDRNNAMVRIGVLAAVDVIQTEQQVADANLTVIQAEIRLQNQQDLLKSLLNLDSVVAEGWDVEVVPTEEATTTAEPIDVGVAVAEALLKSPDIRQDRINRSSRDLDLAAAQNQLLPQLDFIGNIQLSGLGGDQLFRQGPDLLEVQEGALSNSFQQLFSGDFRNWTLGLQLSIPVRNDLARAQFAQATIRQRQAETQVQDRGLQIRLAVRNAIRNIEGGSEQVAAAESALQLAERQYNAELRRFETGTSSTFRVLSFQRQLTIARQRQLNSLINLNLALANFDLSKGTLLDVFGIEVDDAGAGGSMMQSRSIDAAQADAEAEEIAGQAAVKAMVPLLGGGRMKKE